MTGSQSEPQRLLPYRLSARLPPGKGGKTWVDASPGCRNVPAPDIVLAHQEENRRIDVERLRTAGVPVWVTVIRTLEEALPRCAGCSISRWAGRSRRGWPGPGKCGGNPSAARESARPSRSGGIRGWWLGRTRSLVTSPHGLAWITSHRATGRPAGRGAALGPEDGSGPRRRNGVQQTAAAAADPGADRGAQR
jgi:hypothetical protein